MSKPGFAKVIPLDRHPDAAWRRTALASVWSGQPVDRHKLYVLRTEGLVNWEKPDEPCLTEDGIEVLNRAIDAWAKDIKLGDG